MKGDRVIGQEEIINAREISAPDKSQYCDISISVTGEDSIAVVEFAQRVVDQAEEHMDGQ